MLIVVTHKGILGTSKGRIKWRGHANPDTLPIDIKIPDDTKNSASGCSHEYTLILQALVRVYKYCYSAMRLVHGIRPWYKTAV